MTVEELIKVLKTIPAQDMTTVKLEYQRSIGDKIITNQADIERFELKLTENILVIK